MQKIKTLSVPVGGKTFSLYSYGFTTEEALEIREALRDYGVKYVIRFLIEVEAVCSKQLSLTDQPLKKADIDAEKKKMIGHFEKAQKDIEALLDNKIRLVPTVKVNELPLEDMADVELYERYRQRLLTAFYALDDVSKLIAASITPQKQGRPQVDQTQFVKTIVEIYSRHIDTPTTYRDGPFFAVIQAILKAVNLPSEDPSRAIQAALK